jgi:hypothetical protein
VLDEVIVEFPQTLIYTRAYNKWVTNPAGLYQIDPQTGWATDCAVRQTRQHRHVRTDLTSGDSKCCSPNFDCSQCRAYAIATATAICRLKRFATSKDGFADWVDIAEHWAQLFFYDWDELDA